MDIDYFLGVKVVDWYRLKDLMYDYCDGDVTKFINTFKDDKTMVSALHIKVNQLQMEIADMKLPLLQPLFTTSVKCISFNSTGYRCRGGEYEAVSKHEWCRQCVCYDPE